MTPAATLPPLLDAIEAGSLAADRLDTISTGTLIARFATSCYADFGGQCGRGLLCLGGPDLPLGPLTVRTAGLPAGLAVGDTVSIGPSAPIVWQPPRPGNWSHSSMVSGLRAVRDIASGTAADTGLTVLVFGMESPSMLPGFANRARSAIDDLRLWLEAPDDRAEAPERGVRTLLGLGPGLTPSGDDFLVGMLVALSETGDDARQARLSEVVRRLAPIRTSPISTAHLLAACDGMASDALHRALRTILCNAPALADDLNTLAAIGHSSGWDALAGAIIILDYLRLWGSPHTC